jgi:hypothetical protein
MWRLFFFLHYCGAHITVTLKTVIAGLGVPLGGNPSPSHRPSTKRSGRRMKTWVPAKGDA